MNTPVSALPRDEEVQEKIRKVRAFAHKARSVCGLLFGFGLIGIVILLVIAVRAHVPAPNSGNGGAFDILTSSLTPLPLRVWWFLSLGVFISAWLATVSQLYRLFGNLAFGAIYSPDNVRCVRQIGLMWLLLAVLNIALPAALVVANRLLSTPVLMDLDRVFPSFSELFSSFATAGMILLVSWIMDVGLYEKEHADELRREAASVI